MFELYDLSLVRMRLEKTCVMFKGKAVYVSEIGKIRTNKYAINWEDANGNFGISLLPDEFEHFNYADLCIGTVNRIGKAPIWVSRLPVRKYKVGLNPGNTYYTSLNGNYSQPTMLREFSLNRFSLLYMLDNKYPPLSMVDKYPRGLAISRHFSVIQDGLFFKHYLVGRVRDRLRLNPKMGFLQDTLREELGDV